MYLITLSFQALLWHNVDCNCVLSGRLIRGEGEVIEEIVSRDRHQKINRQATRGDGAYFLNTLNSKISR